MLDWLARYEPGWLFGVLYVEAAAALVGLYIAFCSLKVARESLEWIKKEYFYDESKDLEKKQRRTRTKKITTQPGGASVTEETETVEPVSPGEAASEKLSDK